MKIVKLLVLLFYATVVQSYKNGYCEICPNHTFCKYSVGGPTAECKDFDKGALLTKDDIVEIVNRVNSRRNLVATGRLGRFPQAANMKKVRWSTELASFAQRWADQCDPSVRPNKEDECRDLVGLQVGQSIAAVLGLTPGLSVKSFVDMWFMLNLQYRGNVVYYNRSLDEKTNYFTQLIWADTEYVGCGKVKFFNQDVNTVVERLVCNFAPNGNNHGKPVYALGYPATQCPKSMVPDREFLGLCKQDHETATEIVENSSANNLLRILDSSNNSAKQELDPNNIKQINLNNSENRVQRNQKTRHVYLNNPYGAKKRDSFHMQTPYNPINDPENFKGHNFSPDRGHSRMYHGHQTKIEPIHNFRSTQPFSEQDFKRFDLKTTAFSFSIHDHDYSPNRRRIINNPNDYSVNSRSVANNLNDYAPDGHRNMNQNDFALDGRRNQNSQICTRKPKCVDCLPKSCLTNQCTRGQPHSRNSCLKTQPYSLCLEVTLPPPPLPPPALVPLPTPLPIPLSSPDPCSCKTWPTLPLPSDYTMKCPHYPSHNCPQSAPAPLCAKRRAQGDAQDTSKNIQFDYYDLFPNIAVRSGEENIPQRKQLNDSENEDSLEATFKDSEISKQVKETGGNLRKNIQRLQDSYDTFYSSKRKRRNFEDQMTFKPFWQMDEYNNYKRPSELKMLRYTTLRNKKNRKTQKSTFTRLPTESITIKLEDELIGNGHYRAHITEKYLSFEELMHLRKLSTLEALDYEARRLGDDALRAAATTKKGAATTKKAAVTTKTVAATTKKTAATTKKTAMTTKKVVTTTPKLAAATTKPTTVAKTTTELTTITANTPFIRLKQCTRKLTCTWTAIMMTGQDGKPIGPDGGGIIEIGSRTPPGYVDGCTRTSTCTRDFMDRNKVSTTISEEDSSEESTPEDEDVNEDYCEKRSLNVQRRNLDDRDKIVSIEFQDALTEMTPSTPIMSHVTNSDIADDSEIQQYKDSDCICNQVLSRFKRNEISTYEQLLSKSCARVKKNKESKSIDHCDLYNSMLSKMSTSSKLNKIPHHCPCNGSKIIHSTYYLLITLLNYTLRRTLYSAF